MNADILHISDVTRELVQTRLTFESVSERAGNESFVTGRPVTTQHKASDSDYAFVWIYLSPLVLLVGLVGNVLTLCVMSRRRLSGTSTCVYLSAMAVADTLALIFRIPPEFFEACELFVFSDQNR